MVGKKKKKEHKTQNIQQGLVNTYITLQLAAQYLIKK